MNYVQINGLAGDKTMFTIYHLNDTDTSRRLKFELLLTKMTWKILNFTWLWEIALQLTARNI